MIGTVVKSEKSKCISLFNKLYISQSSLFLWLSLESYLHTIVLAEFTKIRNNQFKWFRCITAFTVIY